MTLTSLSVAAGGARYTVETPIQPTIPEDGLGRLAGTRKRNDTSFEFNIAADDDRHDSTEALGGKKRNDTSFNFSIAAGGDTLDSAEARSGKKRTDTSFSFEIVAREPAVGESADAEALDAPKRQSTSFHFERTATPTDGGLAMGEIREASGEDTLPTEAPSEARKKRTNGSFSFEVVATGDETAARLSVSVFFEPAS